MYAVRGKTGGKRVLRAYKGTTQASYTVSARPRRKTHDLTRPRSHSRATRSDADVIDQIQRDLISSTDTDTLRELETKTSGMY